MKHFFTRLTSYKYGSTTDLRKVSLSFTEVGSLNYLYFSLSQLEIKIMTESENLELGKSSISFFFSVILKVLSYSDIFFSLTLSYFLLFPTVLPFFIYFLRISVIIDKKPCISFILKKKKKKFQL